jgi:phage-related protein
VERRTIQIGSYDTAATGDWTLAEWELSAAAHQTNYVKVPGRDGALDFSTALTDGSPTYDSRTLTATLDRSSGSRLEREAAISAMVNWLDGWVVDITLPDDPGRYIRGRVSVAKVYNDMAHARVKVQAVCDPWKYNKEETVATYTATATEQTAELINQGRRTVVPLLTITGGTVSLVFGSASWALGPGTYQLPDLVLPQGAHSIRYSGAGVLTLSYREAVL